MGLEDSEYMKNTRKPNTLKRFIDYATIASSCLRSVPAQLTIGVAIFGGNTHYITSYEDRQHYESPPAQRTKIYKEKRRRA